MKLSVRKLTAAAVIGALYAAFTMVIPLSYPPFEFRFSEVLCILPFFFPESAFGLTVGCVIANLISKAGLPDIAFGSTATLLAGLCTASIGIKARKREKVGWVACIGACFMPVLFNTPIVGAVLAYAFSRDEFWKGFIAFASQVFIGEAGVLFVIGLPVMRYILKNDAIKVFFDRLK